MELKVEFKTLVSAEKMKHNLRHLKKSIPVLRHYISELTEDKYCLMTDDRKNNIAELKYEIKGDTICFSDFQGKHQCEIEEMLTFRFTESIGERAYIYNLDKKMIIYFDLDEYFLVEKDRVYKIGTDNQKIIEIGQNRVPRELRSGVGN